MYDVLVIGGGVAGYYCAMHCAKNGLNVALVEKEELGGTGLRWGCLPVKRMADDLKKLKDKKDIIKNCKEDMHQIEENIKKKMSNLGIHIYFGEGSFEDQHSFIVGSQVLKAKKIVIATGTSPCGFSNIEVDGKRIITHKEAVNLSNIPKRMVIVGANVEGCEFASIFSKIGVEVMLIERENNLLKGNDKDLIQPLQDRLKKQGVKFYLGLAVKEVKKEEKKNLIILEDNTTLETEIILMTAGRKPNFPKGINKLGIITDEQKIKVNETLQTNLAHIYAIGDINGILGMAHVAIQQGVLVAEHILWNKKVTTNYKSLPRAIFTSPEIAGVGFQESELKDQKIPYRVGYCCLKDTWRGFSKRIEEGFIKVLVGEDDRILGIWMVGKDVSELVGAFGFLVDYGVKIDEIKRSLLVHPSLAEGILEAVLNIKK
ncbi:NAD(P)/FAD-dependent oxidoreductase [Crassaminicella thermophila]|uniref:NAD(P)/FAD-dependent oxidoreductase n=1 Tax=Crassaminicella thermophila TaxID=2599308 RepID=A0A5C0SJB6_CRATE|nr:NAD(P)/FAD-dependent oxidoreductase [Crassaminicella thermophila]QEK13049.1 NAD(P)/FAD-dependent oxidoreductase [Crassaminicella thermophila]